MSDEYQDWVPEKPGSDYNVGDRVVKSGLDMAFHGEVHAVIPPDMIPEALAELHRNNPHGTESTIDLFTRMDPTWQEHALYFVEPDSSPGIASYEEAHKICPALTRHQYEMITTRRVFLVLDSQLLPEHSDPDELI